MKLRRCLCRFPPAKGWKISGMTPEFLLFNLRNFVAFIQQWRNNLHSLLVSPPLAR